MQNEKKLNGYRLAVAHFGTQRALAKALGISQPAVCQWRKRGVVPVTSLIKVSKLIGVNPKRLNPKFFGEAEE